MISERAGTVWRDAKRNLERGTSEAHNWDGESERVGSDPACSYHWSPSRARPPGGHELGANLQQANLFLAWGPKVTATAALRGWGSFFLLHVSPRVVGLGGPDCSSRHGCSTLCRVRVHQWPCAAGTTDASRPLWADSTHQLALFSCSSEAGASGVTGPKGSWAIWSWTS